ncbi:MAG TPA: hypothetical protein VLA28_08745, partial [Afifellaceae bacterium]|nr:hypothetical protein [Afifellaceae bacterium]
VYFLGANAMEPIRPDFFGEPLVVFHREINRGVWRIVGPPVTATRNFFYGGPSKTNVDLRPTIAPSKEMSGNGKS